MPDDVGFRIRAARADEREVLEDLQRRASLAEPMYRDRLAADPGLIELPADQIEQGLVRVADDGGAAVGFAVLLAARGGACELDGLFVEPERMRSGIGRALMADAARTARAAGASRIEVVANPQAVAFYTALGFETVGEAETRLGRAPRMSLAV